METRKIIVKVKGYGQIKANGGTPGKVMRSISLDTRQFNIILVKKTEHALHYVATPKDDPAGQAAVANLVMTDAVTGVVVKGDKPEKKSGKGKEPKDVVVTVPRVIFTQALTVATQVCGKQPAILASIRVECTGTSLILQASDLEISYQRILPAEGEKVVRCIPADLLASEVKALPANVADVILTFKVDTVSVNGRAAIVTGDAEEFPTVDIPEAFADTELTYVDDLAAGLAAVLPAASSDDTRFILTGVFVDLDKQKVVATDGMRLHTYPIKPKGDAKGHANVPTKAVKILLKNGWNQQMVLSETEQNHYFSARLSGGILRSKLIEGNYPDYENVMPKALPHAVSFSHKEFVDMVSGAKPLAEGKAIDIKIGDDQLVLKASSSLGIYEWHIPCERKGNNGIGQEMTFNLQFLLDAMKSYPRETVTLKYPKVYGATLVNDQAVVMPIRK